MYHKSRTTITKVIKAFLYVCVFMGIFSTYITDEEATLNKAPVISTSNLNHILLKYAENNI